MRSCETCGSPLEDGLCPACLLGDALTPVAQPEPSAPANQSLPGHWLGIVSRLGGNRDFFQRYNLLERVGQGGQGDIVKVWDFAFRRTVAMKRLNAATAASEPALYRFLAEAQITAQLDHPGILPVFDVGTDPDGRPYFTTQLLSGRTLEAVWRTAHRAKSSTHAGEIEMLLRVCEVMAHAHARGVIHRDLKPSNICVGAHGDVRVIDWGSAHVLEAARHGFEEPFVPLNRSVIQTDRGEIVWGDSSSLLLTEKTGLPTTVLFTPPEVLRGEVNALGPQTDIYSMGVILYMLLAKRPPYGDGNGNLPSPNELRALIQEKAPAPIRSLGIPISHDLAAVTEKALARAREERYLTMTELAEDLRAVLTVHPVKARKPGLWLVTQKWALRNFSYVLIGGVSLVLVALAMSFARARQAERDVARQINAIRSAELAARGGRWREALQHLDAAEAAGYSDTIDLGLQRAEAWTVLGEPTFAKRHLLRLSRRTDLGARLAIVTLRLGEHELFDPVTAREGAAKIRAALTKNLPKADDAFARGLLAETSPEAIELFEEALRHNPYHHGAHRHALGLEFLLGRHGDLSNHVAVFKILYPEDSSAVNVEAAMLAMHGARTSARERLASLQGRLSPTALTQLERACDIYADFASGFTVDAVIQAGTSSLTNGPFLAMEAFGPELPMLPGFVAGGAELPMLRIPELPCLRQGILEGSDALARLRIPYFGDPATATATVQASCRHHPEALVPILAGMILEKQRVASVTNPVSVLQLQSSMYGLAAQLPSMFPNLSRLANYLATRTDVELAELNHANSAAARVRALRSIRRAAILPLTPAESQAYTTLARRLGAEDLAEAIRALWENPQRF